MFQEKVVITRKGYSLFTESTGDPGNPPVLLIMGAMNQGLFWYDSFCDALTDEAFFVIRYDHRDTGFSSVIDYQRSPYDLSDRIVEHLRKFR